MKCLEEIPIVKIKLVDGEFKVLEKGSKEEGSYYIDGILKTNLDKVGKVIRDNWDFVYVVDGEVGAGKSIFCQQLAYYVSNGKFKMNQIVFDPKDFRKEVLKAKKYEAIIFDEAFRGMSARAAMTQTNRILMGMLQEIRQKNLFIFIVLPSIWDLDKYVALHRCKGCFHISVDDDRRRGFWKFYNKGQIMHYLKDYKQKYNYPKAPKMKGRFTNWIPFDEEEYKRKKAKSLGHYGYESEEEQNPRASKYKDEVNKLLQLIKDKGLLDDARRVLDLSSNAVSNRLSRAKSPKNMTFLSHPNTKELTNSKNEVKVNNNIV